LVVRDDKAELEHLWVAPKHIGTGVGKELFLHAMQRASARDVSEVQINSDPNAEGFYQKMGAYRIGEVRADMDDKPRTLPRLAVKPKSRKS
jgi:GNAT superfamily N-acetyltransferase